MSGLITWSDEILFEGQRRGARLVLVTILEKRFGTIPDNVRQRVEKIRSLDRITQLAQRALTAKSLKSLRLG